MKKKVLKFLGRLKWWHWLLVAAGCVAVAVVAFFVVRGMRGGDQQPYSYYFEYENTYVSTRLSPDISFRKSEYCDNCDGYLYDEKTRSRVDPYMPALKWVMTDYEDSLAVGAIEGRRAFFDRFSGEQVTPFSYTRAWLYSEDVAAVTDSVDRLVFIDRRGHRAIRQVFSYSPAMRYEGYLFHRGYCIMNDAHERFGLIDHEGEWAVAAEWDRIVWRGRYWELRRNDSLELLDTMLRVLVPKMCATESRLYSDGNIFVELPHKPSRIYSMDGRLVSDKVFFRVTPLLYRVDHQIESEVETEDEEEILTEERPSACLMYTNMAMECGLMDKHGHILTDAVYHDIEAVDYGLFRAQVTSWPNAIYIMLGADGREIR